MYAASTACGRLATLPTAGNSGRVGSIRTVGAYSGSGCRDCVSGRATQARWCRLMSCAGAAAAASDDDVRASESDDRAPAAASTIMICRSVRTGATAANTTNAHNRAAAAHAAGICLQWQHGERGVYLGTGPTDTASRTDRSRRSACAT